VRAGASATPAPAPRSGVGELLLGLASVFVFLALLEGVARLVDLRPRSGAALANPPWLGERWLLPRSDYRERLRAAGFLGRYYELFEWDRFLIYRLRPRRQLQMIDPFSRGIARDDGVFTVETNAHGFRSRDFGTRAPGRVRIVALGDSSTFGWGVEANEVYTERLREALERRAGAPPEGVEVLNLGVPGYSTFQGLVLLERTALPLEPDLVTWSFLSNDGALTGEADRAAYARRQGLAGALLAALHHSRAFETLEAWIAVGRQRLRPARASPQPSPDARNVAGLAEAERNVREAVTRARDAGVALVLVAQCVRPPHSTLLGRVAASEGLPFLDAWALLQAAAPRVATEPGFEADRAWLRSRYAERTLAAQRGLFTLLPDGCHPNAVGHRLVGEALAELVAPKLPLESTRE
jgi:lysophospholipase L1-like esterase